MLIIGHNIKGEVIFRNKRTGFTLIELLVVISTIALLLAILMPSLNKARRTAKALVCSSNLRQIGLAVNLYVEDNDDKFMPIGGAKYWLYFLGPYLGGNVSRINVKGQHVEVINVAFCPEAKKVVEVSGSGFDPGTAKLAWTFKGGEGSYAVNGWLQTEGISTYGAFTREKYPSTQIAWWGNYFYYKFSEARSNTPMVADSIWVDAWPLSDDEVPQDLSKGDKNVSLGRLCIDRHDMAINVGFVDGHNEKVKLGRLWSLPWSKHFETSEKTIN